MGYSQAIWGQGQRANRNTTESKASLGDRQLVLGGVLSHPHLKETEVVQFSHHNIGFLGTARINRRAYILSYYLDLHKIGTLLLVELRAV